MFLKFNHCAYSMHLTSEYKVLFGKQTHAVQLLYHPQPYGKEVGRWWSWVLYIKYATKVTKIHRLGFCEILLLYYQIVYLFINRQRIYESNKLFCFFLKGEYCCSNNVHRLFVLFVCFLVFSSFDYWKRPVYFHCMVGQCQ